MSLINYLTTIRIDAGAITFLADDLAAASIRRPMLVTDRGIVGAGLATRVLKYLPADTPIFDGTPPNPTEEAVEHALAVYRSGKCDGLVSLGGGSPMDLAKAVAVMATHEGAMISFAGSNGGVARITAATAPTLAIPTTSGTGSEVGRGAVICFRDGKKLALISPYLIPRRAICDPELTLGLPAGLTAATGMDAITHCIECFLSPLDNPIADAISMDGLERGIRALPAAFADGANLHARLEMMMCALEGGLSFQKGLGAVHALSHPLGALREISLHHGTLNSILLPAVLRFNETVAAEKYGRLRAAIGLGPTADVADFIESFSSSLGLPGRLSELGVPRVALPAIADAAPHDFVHATNPRKASVEDYLEILNQAY